MCCRQAAVGLDETDDWNIITPAIISIAILVYFQYFHGYFMKTLDIENQPFYFGKGSPTDETPVGYVSSTRWSTVRDVVVDVLYVHFNKLQFALITMLIMYKVSAQIVRRYWLRLLHVFRRVSTTVSRLSNCVVHPRPDLRTSYLKLQLGLKIIVIIWRGRFIILAWATYELSLKI